jgi:chemotaxis-related protein WspB
MLCLLFQLGDERYAIKAAEVREVLPTLAVRSIPHAPDGIAGIVDYRGTSLPVVDLAQLVLSRAASPRLSTRLIVAGVGSGEQSRLLGLVAERVTEVVHTSPADFQPSGVSTAQAPYLEDVIRVGGSLRSSGCWRA